MKFFSTIVLLFAGLASVQAQNNTASATESVTDIASQSVTSTSSSASSTATASLQDFLNNLGGGLNNLGNINFNNRNDVINAIGLLMNQLCVGNFFNGNLLSGLGSNQQLQLLFQLDQLNQLNRLGFLNSFDLQGIFNRGFGGINLGGGIVRGANGFNRGGVFNLAGFKRAAGDAMAKLDTNPERRNVNVKRQQQLCNVAGVVTGGVGRNGRARQTSTTTSAAQATATAETEE